jgi:hypothetical protein
VEARHVVHQMPVHEVRAAGKCDPRYRVYYRAARAMREEGGGELTIAITWRAFARAITVARSADRRAAARRRRRARGSTQ